VRCRVRAATPLRDVVFVLSRFGKGGRGGTQKGRELRELSAGLICVLLESKVVTRRRGGIVGQSYEGCGDLMARFPGEGEGGASFWPRVARSLRGGGACVIHKGVRGCFYDHGRGA